MLPLIVDLDGTLLRSDMLIETASAVASTRPGLALLALTHLRHGRAALKQHIASLAPLDLGRLPWNDEMLAFLRAERARGRPLYLASAADARVVDAVAAHFGIFTGVFASDGATNAKGEAKAAQLVAAFGAGQFAYAGNEAADFPVWREAGERLVVNASPAVLRRARGTWPEAVVLSPRAPTRPGTVLRAMRAHQWLKNLLLFVPALAAHRPGALGACVLAFVSFSLCASAVYLGNDLLDLSRDRTHARKRLRPIAAGRLRLRVAAGLVPLLGVSAVVIGLVLPPGFLPVVALYGVVALAYSLVIKRVMMLDVVTLACLYGVRLQAGAAASQTPLSAWMAAYALFVFTCLALVKRCTELIGRGGDPPGRSYRLSDLPMLQSLAAASGFTAVLVLALYVSSPEVARLYAHPARLWVLTVVMIVWLGRVLLLTARGEMHDDPVVFAATDRGSLLCAAIGCAAVVISV